MTSFKMADEISRTLVLSSQLLFSPRSSVEKSQSLGGVGLPCYSTPHSAKPLGLRQPTVELITAALISIILVKWGLSVNYFHSWYAESHHNIPAIQSQNSDQNKMNFHSKDNFIHSYSFPVLCFSEVCILHSFLSQNDFCNKYSYAYTGDAEIVSI